MNLPLLLTALALSAASLPARAQVCPGIVHEELTVDGRNDEWTSAKVKVGPKDLVIVFARGKVKLGPVMGWIGPAGKPDGLGRLDMKVGTGTVVPVGERWVGAFTEPGKIKFKVYDSKYTDNEGGYTIHLIIIPSDAFPPAIQVDAQR